MFPQCCKSVVTRAIVRGVPRPVRLGGKAVSHRQLGDLTDCNVIWRESQKAMDDLLVLDHLGDKDGGHPTPGTFAGLDPDHAIDNLIKKCDDGPDTPK